MTRILNFKVNNIKGTGEIVGGADHDDGTSTFKVIPINGQNFKEYGSEDHLWVTNEQVRYFESIFTG